MFEFVNGVTSVFEMQEKVYFNHEIRGRLRFTLHKYNVSNGIIFTKRINVVPLFMTRGEAGARELGFIICLLKKLWLVRKVNSNFIEKFIRTLITLPFFVDVVFT